MTKVFVSYRRDDSAHAAGRLRDRLSAQFGEDNVFYDVDSIPLLDDVVEFIERTIARTDVVVVLIGNAWAVTRLREPDDYVRLEISEAISQGKPLLPVLVDDASMPSAASLPKDLRLLVFRNAARLRRDPDFHVDAGRLIKAIGDHSSSRPNAQEPGIGLQQDNTATYEDQRDRAQPKGPASITPAARGDEVPDSDVRVVRRSVGRSWNRWQTLVSLTAALVALAIVAVTASQFMRSPDGKAPGETDEIGEGREDSAVPSTDGSGLTSDQTVSTTADDSRTEDDATVVPDPTAAPETTEVSPVEAERVELDFTNVADLGGAPRGITATPEGTWVARLEADDVVLLDEQWNVVATIDVGDAPRRILASGGFVWVSVAGEDQVVQINQFTRDIVSRIDVGDDPRRLAETSDAIWVTNALDGSVTRISRADLSTTTVEDVCVGDDRGVRGARGIATTADAVWVSCIFEDEIVQLDADSLQVQTRIPIVGGPEPIAVGTDGFIWVATVLTDEPRLYRVDTADGSSELWMDLDARPRIVLVINESLIAIAAADGNSVWLVDWQQRTVLDEEPIASPEEMHVAGLGLLLTGRNPDAIYRSPLGSMLAG